MAKIKKERVVFRIEITPGAKANITETVDRLGITQIALGSRVVTWLSNQPDDVKAGVLGLFPELVNDPASSFLHNLAGTTPRR